MASPHLIDPAAIRNLRTLNTDGSDDFLREIVALFSADLPARIAELDQSLAEGNRRKFERAAHSIKGSAANLGAASLKAAAEKIEAQSDVSGLDGIESLVGELKAEAARAQLALGEILASPPSAAS